MTPRPVSGEIMTRAPRRDAARVAQAQVLDASFTDIGPAGAFPGEIAPEKSGMASLNKRSEPEARSARGGPLFWTGGVALAALSFWISGGHSLMPASQAVAAQGGLVIEAVRSRIDTSGARPLLLVDGRARNSGESARALPAIVIAVQDEGGDTVQYRIASDGGDLAAGSTHAFAGRLRVPAAGVKKVAVSFQPQPGTP